MCLYLKRIENQWSMIEVIFIDKELLSMGLSYQECSTGLHFYLFIIYILLFKRTTSLLKTIYIYTVQMKKTPI
jgi:hypothetical protein